MLLTAISHEAGGRVRMRIYRALPSRLWLTYDETETLADAIKLLEVIASWWCRDIPGPSTYEEVTLPFTT